MPDPLPVVCMLVGKRYTVSYVEKLSSMLRRKAGLDHQLWCIVDRPHDLPASVNKIDASNWTEMRREGMRVTTNKLRLFDEEVLPFKEFLYLDLTLVIQKNLKELVDHANAQSEDLVIVKDWNYDCFNSCVMRIRHSPSLRRVYELFREGKVYQFRNPGDQDFLNSAFKELGLHAAYFRPEHVVDYRGLRKLHRIDPEKAYEEIAKGHIVKFYGTPKMHQVLNPVYRLVKMGLQHPSYGFKDMRFWVKELRANWR